MGSPFEIDPSIMLMRPRESNAGESLASLLESGQRRQMQAQQMQQQQYQFQRQQRMADLARQSAGLYSSPIGQAYASAGFGDEAAQADHAALQRQQLGMSMAKIHRELTASRLAAATTQEQFDKIAADSPEEYGLTPGRPYQDQVKAFRQSLITPEQEAENNKTRYRVDPFGRVLDSFTGQLVGDAQSKGGGSAGAGAVGIGSLPQSALDVLVDKAVVDGDMPRFGSGALGMQQRNAFLARFAEKYPGQNLGQARATFRAGMHNLTEATAQGAAQDVNEGKALADIEILQKTMKPLLNTGSPFLNKVGRELQQASGNSDVAAYLTARQAAVATINRVLNAGTLTESARKEAEELLNKDLTPSQMNAALEVLKQDMARSSEATHKRQSAARAGLTPPPAAGKRGAQAQPLTGATNLDTSAPVRRTIGGKTYEKDAEGWHEVTGG